MLIGAAFLSADSTPARIKNEDEHQLLCMTASKNSEYMSEVEAVSRPLCIMYTLIHYEETEGSFTHAHARSMLFLSTAYQIKLVLQSSLDGEYCLSRGSCAERLTEEKMNNYIRPSLVREKHFHHNAN